MAGMPDHDDDGRHHLLTRVISADAIFGAITEHRHAFGGAPIVLAMLVNAPEAQKPNLTIR